MRRVAAGCHSRKKVFEPELTEVFGPGPQRQSFFEPNLERILKCPSSLSSIGFQANVLHIPLRPATPEHSGLMLTHSRSNSPKRTFERFFTTCYRKSKMICQSGASRKNRPETNRAGPSRRRMSETKEGAASHEAAPSFTVSRKRIRRPEQPELWRRSRRTLPVRARPGRPELCGPLRSRPGSGR